MIVKAFEIRDKGTFIPALAVKMVPWPFHPDSGMEDRGSINDAERYLLRRAGYGFYDPCVVLVRMDCNGGPRQAACDPHDWGERTFPVAHRHIVDHFDELESGAVVDVEFILGETKEPKKSEREG